MGDPYVRVIGEVEDGIAALPLRVGIDHGTVTVGCGAITWRLDSRKTEEFQQLYVAACWQAAVNLTPFELAELKAAAEADRGL